MSHKAGISMVKATLPRNSNPLCNYEGSPCSACRYIAHWSCKKPITDENLISSLWEKHPSRKKLFTLRKAPHYTGFWCEAKEKAVSNPNFQQNGSIYLPEVSIRIKETMHTPSHWTLAESNRINWDRKLFFSSCFRFIFHPQDLLSLILCKNLFLQVFLQFIFSISDNFHQTAKPISLPISPLISFFYLFLHQTLCSILFCVEPLKLSIMFPIFSPGPFISDTCRRQKMLHFEA